MAYLYNIYVPFGLPAKKEGSRFFAPHNVVAKRMWDKFGGLKYIEFSRNSSHNNIMIIPGSYNHFRAHIFINSIEDSFSFWIDGGNIAYGDSWKIDCNLLASPNDLFMEIEEQNNLCVISSYVSGLYIVYTVVSPMLLNSTNNMYIFPARSRNCNIKIVSCLVDSVISIFGKPAVNRLYNRIAEGEKKLTRREVF